MEECSSRSRGNMKTRTRARHRTSQWCRILLSAALAVSAVVTLTTPVDTDNIPSNSWVRAKAEGSTADEEVVHLQVTKKQGRDYVTLRDIELVGSAASRAASDLLVPHDDQYKLTSLPSVEPPQSPPPPPRPHQGHFSRRFYRRRLRQMTNVKQSTRL